MPTTLNEVPEPAWKAAADRLNDVGVFADEERAFPDVITLDRDLRQFEETVRRHGYTGRPLSVGRVDRPSEGVEFLLFDRNRLGDFQAAVATWSQNYASRWRKRVSARVEDWIKRLHDLKATMKGWLPQGMTLVDRPPIDMREEMMTRFDVEIAKMPAFEIHKDALRLMRVQPKAPPHGHFKPSVNSKWTGQFRPRKLAENFQTIGGERIDRGRGKRSECRKGRSTTTFQSST